MTTNAFWIGLVGPLALASTVLLIGAAWLENRVSSAAWRRALWQIVFLLLLIIPVAEMSGIGRGTASFLFGKERSKPQFTVSISDNPVLIDTSATMTGEKAVPIVRITKPAAVWWPGVIWLAGAALILGRMAVSQILCAAMRLRRDGPVESEAHLYEMAARMGIRGRVRLVLARGLSSPIAFGLVRPAIGVPGDFVKRFKPDQRKAMLAHELAHLANRDPLWRLVADAAAALFWWQPLVWMARHKFHAACELAADEASAMVDNGPRVLAECLVALGRDLSGQRRWAWIGVEGGGFKSNLGRRVERLMRLTDNASTPSRVPSVWLRTSIAAALALFAIIATGWAESLKSFKQSDWASSVRQAWSSSPGAVLLAAAQTAKQRDPAALTRQYAQLNTTSQLTNTVDSKQTRAWIVGEDAIGDVMATPAWKWHKVPPMSDEERKRNDVAALADPQMIFKGDCAKCHLSPAAGQTGIGLYYNLCGVCHEDGYSEGRRFSSSTPKAPKLRGLQMPADPEVWRKIIREGKTNTVMPAFAQEKGGPLSVAQIDSLARFLATAFSRASMLPAAAPGTLMTKMFSIDTDRFIQNLEKGAKTDARLSTNTPAEVNQRLQEMLRSYLTQAGIDLSYDGASMYFNDTKGLVLIRARLQDMTSIEDVISQLSAAPAQVSIEAVFFDLDAAGVQQFEGYCKGDSYQPAQQVEVLQSQKPVVTFGPFGSRTNDASEYTFCSISDPMSRLVRRSVGDEGNRLSLTTLDRRQAHIARGGNEPFGRSGVLSYTLDVLPAINPDKKSFTLTLSPCVDYPVTNAAGIPSVETSGVAAEIQVADQRTVVIRGLKLGTREIVVCVRPALIDAAGNLINKTE